VKFAVQQVVLDRDIAALNEACFAQAFAESGHDRPRGSQRSPVYVSHNRHRRLLRPCRQRPRRSRGATKEREEGAAVHGMVYHSTSSSARIISASGTSRPRALAVLVLITSSILVENCTGRSPGVSPLRMRST